MRGLLVALLCGLAVTAGCRCGSRDADSTQTQTPTTREPTPSHLKTRSYTQPQVEHLVPPPKVPSVESFALEAAGAAPRRAYRYAKPADEPRELVIATTPTTRELRDGAWGPRVALPELQFGLGVIPGDAAPKSGGDVILHVRGLEAHIGEPRAQGKLSAKDVTQIAQDTIARYQAHVARRRATVALTDRGLLGDLTVTGAPASDGPSHTKQELEQILIETVVPLPEEPIGVGAVWRVKTLLRRGAAYVRQDARYQLTAIEDGQLVIAANIRQIGERQRVSPPELRASAELIQLFWRSEGTFRVAIGDPIPRAATVDNELRVHTRIPTRQGVVDYFIESVARTAISVRARPGP